MKSTDNAKQQNIIHPILKRLQQNDTYLTSLLILESGKPTKKSTIYYHPRNVQDWELLGQAIATNTNLIRLDIKFAQHTYHNSSRHLTRQTLNAFYAQLNKNRSIRRLSFNNVDMQDGRLFSERLLRFFQNNTKLTSLSVIHQSLGTGSTNQLSRILTAKPTSLKYINLSYIYMNDEECRILCTSLESHHLGLRSLELNDNRLQNGGCVAIATLLVNPNCVLNRLCLQHNQIDNHGAVALSDGLTNNKHLKTLQLHGNNAMTLQGMNSLMKTVCNSPNVTDIVNSNHTLQTLTLPFKRLEPLRRDTLGLDKERKLSMQYSLRFNNRGSSNQVSSSNNGSSKNKISYIINQKVVLHHFIFNTNIQLYEELPGHLLPRLLSSIANYEVYNTKRSDEFASKDELFAKKDYNRRHAALHRFIRLCPSICERWVGGGGGNNVESQVEGPAVDSSIKRMRYSYLSSIISDNIYPSHKKLLLSGISLFVLQKLKSYL